MSDGGIQPPVPPQPPPAPRPPAPGKVDMVAAVFGSNDPKVLLRKLLGHLQKKTTIDLSLMPVAHIAAMEAAMVTTLTRDELAKHGLELRRVLRFAIASRAGITRGSGGQPFPVEKPGTKGKAVLIPRISRSASVKVMTKVKIRTGWARDSGEAYTLEFAGAAGFSWLQFVWRQISFVRGGVPKSLQLRVNHGGKAYLLTSDKDAPRWSTDALHRQLPFYEHDTTLLRSGDRLVLCDDPSPMESYAKELLDGPGAPSEVSSKFRAAAYLVRDRDVFYVANVEIDWTIKKKGGRIVSELAKEEIKPKLASELSAAHRATLARQYPGSDYFPGPAIGPPVPDDPFEPIALAGPALAAWPAGQDWQKRYDAAAQVARAQLIEDVREPLKVNSGPSKPGLNFDTSLSEQGQTGFIDASARYHNPDIPLSRHDPLPGIAILLGRSAFDWKSASASHERTRDYTIATLRHEMLHARHAKLAIGWLLRWRDQLTPHSFEKWLDDERTAKRIGKADYHIVRVALAKGTSPTEIFAWLEGFLTAIPFLPSPPGLAHIPAEKWLWPTAVNELDGCLRFLNRSTIRSVFEPAVKSRVRTFVCGGLTKPQRDGLVGWLDALIDPDALSPATAADKRLVASLRAEARGQLTLLKDLRRITLSCKP